MWRNDAVIPEHSDTQFLGNARSLYDFLSPRDLEQRRLDQPRLVLEHNPTKQG